jgi:hypothetical protein
MIDAGHSDQINSGNIHEEDLQDEGTPRILIQSNVLSQLHILAL